jgi:hypothetical protein
MKRFLAALVLLLVGCGESTEAKLERCKNKMRAQLKEMTAILKEADGKAKDLAKPDANAPPMVIFHGTMMKALPSIIAHIEAQLSTMSGPEGLARCEEMLFTPGKPVKVMRPPG